MVHARYGTCVWPVYCMGQGSVQRDSNVTYVAFGPDEFEPERAPGSATDMTNESATSAALLDPRRGQHSGGGGGGGESGDDGEVVWEVRYSRPGVQ